MRVIWGIQLTRQDVPRIIALLLTPESNPNHCEEKLKQT